MYEEYIKRYYNEAGFLKLNGDQLFKEDHPFFDFSELPEEKAVEKLIYKTLGPNYSFSLFPKGVFTGGSYKNVIYLLTNEKERYYLKVSHPFVEALGMVIASHLHKEMPFDGLDLVDLMHYGSLSTKKSPLLFFTISKEAPGIDLVKAFEQNQIEPILEFTKSVGKIIPRLADRQMIKATQKDKIILLNKALCKYPRDFYSYSVELDKESQKLTEELFAKWTLKMHELQTKFLEEDHYLIPYYAKFDFPNLRFDPKNKLITNYDTAKLPEYCDRSFPPLIFPDILVAEHLERMNVIIWEKKLDPSMMSTICEAFWTTFKKFAKEKMITKTGLSLFSLGRLPGTLRIMKETNSKQDKWYSTKDAVEHYTSLLEDDHPLFASFDD